MVLKIAAVTIFLPCIFGTQRNEGNFPEVYFFIQAADTKTDFDQSKASLRLEKVNRVSSLGISVKIKNGQKMPSVGGQFGATGLKCQKKNSA